MAVFIGGLSYQVTKDALFQVFSEYGTVRYIALPTDRETGRVRGFALVHMETDEEESAVIAALDGTEWMGRDLNVSKAS